MVPAAPCNKSYSAWNLHFIDMNVLWWNHFKKWFCQLATQLMLSVSVRLIFVQVRHVKELLQSDKLKQLQLISWKSILYKIDATAPKT